MIGHDRGRSRVEWIVDDARLRQIEPAWQTLADALDSPFAGPESQLAWWDAFGADLAPRCCALWEDDALIAFLPLAAAGPRGLRSATNDNSSMLVPAARDADALEALFDAVLASGREVELVPLWAPPETRDALGRAARRHGVRTVSESWVAAPFVATDGDLDDYRRANHPSWLKRLARYRRQMERKYAFELVVAEPPADLQAEVEAGLALEASGWKGAEGSAILSSEAAQRFYLELAERWQARGELRLSRMTLDGRLVAFDMAVERGGRLFSLKTAYDEAYRQIVPGLVLRLSIVETCFERGLVAHELLGDMYEWKAKFSTGERDLQRVRLYPPKPAPLARWAWTARIKPVLKRGRRALLDARRRAAALRRRQSDAPSERPAP